MSSPDQTPAGSEYDPNTPQHIPLPVAPTPTTALTPSQSLGAPGPGPATTPSSFARPGITSLPESEDFRPPIVPQPRPSHVPSTIAQSSWQGYVSNTLDALILFEAARRGLIPRVQRRLRTEDRQRLIRSGHVFIFDEEETNIKRWTDGLMWSPSRILQNFLVYRQIERKPYSGRSSFAGRGSVDASAGSGSDTWPNEGSSARPSVVSPFTSLDAPRPDSRGGQTSSQMQSDRSFRKFQMGRTAAPAFPRPASQASKNAPLLPVPGGGTLRDSGMQPPSPPPGTPRERTGSFDSSLDLLSSSHSRKPSSSKSSTRGSLRRRMSATTPSSSFVQQGLCKKTISTECDGHHTHLIAYYTLDDVLAGRLIIPSMTDLASLQISSDLLHPSKFRVPLVTKRLEDGSLIYVGEPDVGHIPTSFLPSDQSELSGVGSNLSFVQQELLSGSSTGSSFSSHANSPTSSTIFRPVEVPISTGLPGQVRSRARTLAGQPDPLPQHSNLAEFAFSTSTPHESFPGPSNPSSYPSPMTSGAGADPDSTPYSLQKSKFGFPLSVPTQPSPSQLRAAFPFQADPVVYPGPPIPVGPTAPYPTGLPQNYTHTPYPQADVAPHFPKSPLMPIPTQQSVPQLHQPGPLGPHTGPLPQSLSHASSRALSSGSALGPNIGSHILYPASSSSSSTTSPVEPFIPYWEAATNPSAAPGPLSSHHTLLHPMGESALSLPAWPPIPMHTIDPQNPQEDATRREEDYPSQLGQR